MPPPCQSPLHLKHTISILFLPFRQFFFEVRKEPTDQLADILGRVPPFVCDRLLRFVSDIQTGIQIVQAERRFADGAVVFLKNAFDGHRPYRMTCVLRRVSPRIVIADLLQFPSDLF